MSVSDDRESLRDPWAWAGTADEFLASAPDQLLHELAQHSATLNHEAPSPSQMRAWTDELEVLHRELDTAPPSARADWSVILEYELPFEGGRRPDVLVLAGGTVAVIEFKGRPPSLAQLDQVQAYARDLAEYHEGTHARRVEAILVSTALDTPPSIAGPVHVVGQTGLGPLLEDVASRGAIDLHEWLTAPYRPLPTLVAAAQRIFRHGHLPHVRRALAARIPETITEIHSLINETQENGLRRLILLTGVPGAGKTLVGLRLVYERSEGEPTATFLSGNGAACGCPPTRTSEQGVRTRPAQVHHELWAKHARPRPACPRLR